MLIILLSISQNLWYQGFQLHFNNVAFFVSLFLCLLSFLTVF